MATSMKIFVKKTGEDAMPLTATLDDTIGSVKEKLQLKNVSMRLLKTQLKIGTSLRNAGVKDGDTLTAVAVNKVPTGFSSRGSYQAAKRLGNKTCKKSNAHPELHMLLKLWCKLRLQTQTERLKRWARM